jgi:hypothetical protein
MLRSLLATTVAPLTGLASCLALLCASGTTALAAETGQGYTPSATVTVAPAYAPPPTYAPPPPAYGAAPAPQYAAPAPQYGSPPPRANTYGGSRYAADFEIARPGWSISAMLGFGFNDVYDFGIGVRAGYTLPQHIYIGGEFAYFFGGGDNVYSYSTYNIGPEIGYDIGLAAAPILIRPYVGLGLDGVSISSNFCGNHCPSDPPGFALWGGAMSTYNFTRNWSAGVDLRLIIPVFSNDAEATNYAAPGLVALTLSAMGSYKF